MTTLQKLMWLKKATGGTPTWAWETVTGTPPLTLSGAIAKRLKFLQQTGAVSYTGTPTPASPVDFLFNNGHFRLVDNELPSGFKRITGIKFDGDCWFDTGRHLFGSDEVTITLDDTVSTGQNVFGAYSGTAAGTKNFSFYVYGGGSSNGSYLRYGEQLVRPKFGSGKRTLTISGTGTTGFATDVTITPDTFETEANAYIGMLPNSSSAAYTGTVVGSVLISDRLEFIPCERTADGVVGYYERINGVFIEPSGTGTPVKGAYDYSKSHVETSGPNEVISLAGNTATVEDLLAIVGYADTQNILSGHVVRRVGFKVFDGTETFQNGTNGYITEAVQNQKDASYVPLCTHFSGTASAPARDSETVRFYRTSGGTGRIYFAPNLTTFPTVADFTAWLKAQHDAGTPVIVLYALDEEQTETVAAQTLSTAEGSNTLAVTQGTSGPMTVTYAKSL